MKIGLIGAGAIANFLLEKLQDNKLFDAKIESILVRDKQKYKPLKSTYHVELYTNVDDFLSSNIDIVVEVANIEAVQTIIPKVIKEKDTIIISIGALADETFLQRLTELASVHQHSIYLPSGAIGGLDLLQHAQALGTVSEVALTTRKPAYSLIDRHVDRETIVFEGNAVEAIQQFPKNMNVSVVLSLAGLGVKQTKVRLIADPHATKNTHEINIKGDFGTASFSISNNPLPENPKTSYLAAMSIIGTLQRLKGSIKIS